MAILRRCDRSLGGYIGQHGGCSGCDVMQDDDTEHYVTGNGRIVCAACMPAYVLSDGQSIDGPK